MCSLWGMFPVVYFDSAWTEKERKVVAHTDALFRCTTLTASAVFYWLDDGVRAEQHGVMDTWVDVELGDHDSDIIHVDLHCTPCALFPWIQSKPQMGVILTHGTRAGVPERPEPPFVSYFAILQVFCAFAVFALVARYSHVHPEFFRVV